MNEGSGILLALLAAGQSRRFGDSDKLGTMLGDKMLGLHAAGAVADLPFVEKLVIGPPEHPCASQWSALGYRILANGQAARGQATSVRLAAAHALETGARALCIMLADMPFVTRDHVGGLISAFERSDGKRTVASVRGGRAMPPAVFPAGALPSLLALQGDRGARSLLAEALPVQAEDPVLIDIDTAEDLAHASDLLAGIE